LDWIRLSNPVQSDPIRALRETESSCDVLAFSRDAGARDAHPKSAAMISELVESEDEESDESEDIDKSPAVKVNL
jgi:hypothetical protein